MQHVRLGVVGIGNMGTTHCQNILDGKVPRLQLAAVCDLKPEKTGRFPNVPAFRSSAEMIRSGTVDAVLVATPHYDHTTIGIDTLQNGLHLLVEKPISVHKADCQRLIAAHTNKKQVFAAMFNQRTDPFFIKIRDLIQNGELGEIRRVSWIITNWFRTEAYYASGGWRATWRGEGGGVLLNQCPHQLDLFQWLFGMPASVRAFCNIGKYHKIEVEDEVTAVVGFANGATGMFVTSTGEAPGTNRLEVVGERGKVVYEADHLTYTRNEIPMSEYSRTTTDSFSCPPVWNIQIPLSGHGGQHNQIMANFADAILDGAPLIAPAEEGIHSVELANAMLYSTFTDSTVQMPLDAVAYEERLQKLIKESRFEKKVVETAPTDFSKSFSR